MDKSTAFISLLITNYPVPVTTDVSDDCRSGKGYLPSDGGGSGEGRGL